MSSSEHILGGAAIPQRASRARPADSATPTVWFFAILVIGAWIVLVDGITRAPMLDINVRDVDAFSYEPHIAAFIFAAVMFPLVMLHAIWTRASKTEGAFLWFVLCTFTYGKDFSYIKAPGVPIYITDITLVVLLLLLFLWPRLRLVNFKSPVILALLAFLFLGTVAMVGGLNSGQEVPRTFRDYAIVVYSLFTLVGLYLVRSWTAIFRIVQMTWIGAALLSLNGVAWFISAPVGQRRYVAYGLYIVIALITLIIAVINRVVNPAIGWAFGVLLGVGLVVASARSLYVCLGVGIVLIMLGSSAVGKKVDFMRVVKGMAVFIVAAALALVIFVRTGVGAEFVERTTEDAASGLLHSEDDDNVQFRMLAWAEALDRFGRSPWMGEGFGVPFIFELTDMDARPHNTFLTVLYKMGMIGLAPFLYLLFQVFRKGWTAFAAVRGDPNAFVLYGLLLVQLMLCVYGSFNLLIESPFLASIFWFNMGMTLRATRLLQANNQRLEA